MEPLHRHIHVAGLAAGEANRRDLHMFALRGRFCIGGMAQFLQTRLATKGIGQVPTITTADEPKHIPGIMAPSLQGYPGKVRLEHFTPRRRGCPPVSSPPSFTVRQTRRLRSWPTSVQLMTHVVRVGAGLGHGPRSLQLPSRRLLRSVAMRSSSGASFAYFVPC